MAGSLDIEKSVAELPAHVDVLPPTIYHPPGRIRRGPPANAYYPNVTSSVCDSTIKECNLEPSRLQIMTDHDTNSRPSCFSNWAQEWAFVFTVMLASSSTTIIQGVVLIMTNTIGQGLKASAPQVTWIAAAVGLGSGSFMLFFGKVADEMGRKIQLLIGLLFMSAFALVAAWSPGPYELIVVCGLLGMCTAVIAPPALGILFAAYPEGRRRNLACGALGTGNPVGFILGSVSSGLAVKYYGWRASFVVMAIFFFLLVILAFWTVPVITRVGNRSDAIRRFDYAGSIFIVLAVALISAGLTEGPQSGWLSVHVVLLLIFGIFFILGFIAWEYFYENPLLDLSVWRNGNFSLCVICMGFGYMSFITNEFWIALYMQDVQHYMPLQIAARMLPQAVAGVFWSFLGQWLIQKVHGTIVMGIGSLMYLAGASLLLFIKEDTSYWLFLFPALVITVIGADFQFIVANQLYANKQMPTQASLGVGIIQTAYRLSITIGLAITSAVFNTATSKEAIIEDPTIPYRRVYICAIIFASIGLACIPFMRIQTRAKDDTFTPPRPTTLRSENNDGMIVNHPSSQSHYDTLLRQLNLHRENPLNTDERVYRGHRAEINNAQRYDPALPRSMTMNDIAQGLLRLPRWSWENRPRAGFWRNRRGSQCHWESSSGDIFEICKKCKEERKIKDEEGAWQEIGEAGRDCVKEGGRGKGTRAMELEIKDERRFTV
ncbi:putative major facilitator superfamily protein [Botrytis fragariae]|uniref:Putative major facilitator superfamily protein n=1 Tax=Botrytis fragariae TaxID=1964551 RepID=A0A8H6B0G3_9HELO|nr:putative major facilitator superfamily protein [Botrytis fragariae]KAF5876847.1 putative major facilitator superfamily protein [Botrytis fragariae]